MEPEFASMSVTAHLSSSAYVDLNAYVEGSVYVDGEDLYGPGVDPVAVRRKVGHS